MSATLTAPRELVVRSTDDAARLMGLVRASAARAQAQVASLSGDPLGMLRRMKFDQIGYHPIEDRPLNLVEQINQTWSMAVAIEAAKKLLELHPEAGGFRLAPGAHASLELDIMSVESGLVGAETFAAVHPRNNGKLRADLAKLAARQERYRYVFFLSPIFPRTERQTLLEMPGVEVWSLEI
jgi:hypothetical protein